MSDNKQVTRTGTGLNSLNTENEQQRAVLPAVDVFEDASGITLLADMPGVPKDQLELKIEGDALLIEGGVQALTPEGLEAPEHRLRSAAHRLRPSARVALSERLACRPAA